jgi:aminopeptidase N
MSFFFKQTLHQHSLLLFFLLSFYSAYSTDHKKIDVLHYNLKVNVNIGQKSIEGSNEVRFKVVKATSTLLLNLYENLLIDSIVHRGKKVCFTRDSNRIYIYLNKELRKKSVESVAVFYHGIPTVAKNPPWDGGFVWGKDSLDNDWVAVACQGKGGSLWWPCKEDQTDEPDSMRISISCPTNLMAVSNGTYLGSTYCDSNTIYHWSLHYPINNYNVTLNIGNYIHFSDSLVREDHSVLPLDYYVLSYNEEKAKVHFEQVQKILACYEGYFGPYPFPKDGYALVETPYWGMEHQSAIAYGNHFKNNLGPFDFIIAHESAHEWWGNSLTASSNAELWIHESFATYSESLLLEDYLGPEKALAYLLTQRKKILNEQPMLKPSDEFEPEDTDIYYKGTWMLHTIRNVINNDDRWFKIIKNLSVKKRHHVVTSSEVIQFISKRSKKNLTPIFHHYLYTIDTPIFQYTFYHKKNKLGIKYRWKNVSKDFHMPVWLEVKGKKILMPCQLKYKQKVLGEISPHVVRVLEENMYIRSENLQDEKK